MYVMLIAQDAHCPAQEGFNNKEKTETNNDKKSFDIKSLDANLERTRNTYTL